MSSIAETFAVAVQYHQAGNLRQAEHLYRQVLQVVPDHVDSLHLLGVLAYQTGHSEQAVPLIKRALSMNPWVASYYSNLGLAHQALGQMEQSLASFYEALRLEPDYADAHSNLADALRVAGRLPESIIHCQKALRIQPRHPQALGNLGNALLAQGNFDEAVACFRAALQLNANMAVVHNSLANALERQGKLDEAIRSCQEALRLNPNYAEAFNNLGVALKAQNKLDDAVHCYREAIRLSPNYAEAFNNLGVVLKKLDRLDEAASAYQQALKIKPDYAEASSNMGNVARTRGDYEEALGWYDQALRHDAGHAEAHLNKGLLWLLLGDWARGWPDYEWRWKTNTSPRLALPQPRWDGSPLAGRTLLVLGEQGLGDTLHCIRYVKLLSQRGDKVLVQCQPALERLLAHSLEPSQLVLHGSPFPPFEVYAPLLSLPGILGTTPANIPAEVPYLHADATLVEQWRRELQPVKGLKVGVAWRGSPTFADDRLRSFPAAQLTRLAKVEGVQLISLQKGAGAEQARDLGEQFPLIDLGSRLHDFMDTAAVMKNLDLVIFCDTAGAHLAGGLGVPVWLPLPLVPDWRWLLEREDTPWYPSMRLFRQTRRGNWDDVFERMAEELSMHVGKP